MASKEFIMDLAKLIIAAAWADNELTNEEINALKDMLFRFDKITGEDWKILQMYIESPVTQSEQEELLNRVMKEMVTAQEKALAIEMLRNTISCDGVITSEEEEMLQNFISSIQQVDTGLIKRFSNVLKTKINKRTEAVSNAYLREEHFEDYLQNIVYYDLTRKLEQSNSQINKSENKLKKICLAAGLMTQVAVVDLKISSEEKKAICKVLSEDWQISYEEASLIFDLTVARKEKGLDYYRLTHNYFEITSYEERKNFLFTLFRIANAANGTSYDETEEIRTISHCLKLSHNDFINAKKSILE